MQKGLKAFVLTIILGVPVIWYLFLQLFGTNEFTLPTLGTVQDSCNPSGLSIYIQNEPRSTEGLNQLNRSKQNELTKSLLHKPDANCQFEDWDLILVSGNLEIKGAYYWSIEDIDRLITEVELYHTIDERHGAGN